MAPDRSILHLVVKHIYGGRGGGLQTQTHSLSKIMACTLLSLSYAPELYTRLSLDMSDDCLHITHVR